MRKAVLREPKHFELVDSDIPKIGDDELLVRVKYCGICGSDLHSYAGKNQFSRMPYVPGHEYVGKVEDTGKNITNFRVGQVVIAEPGIQCNRCIYCKRGDYQLCSNQTPSDGAFAEYIVIKEWKTFALPQSIDYQKATLIEPIACVLHAIDLAEMKNGQSLLIHGAGPIGQLLSRVVRAFGAHRVAITDLYMSRLALAKKGGGDLAIQIKDGYTASHLVKDIGPDLIDIVFDTVSNDYSMNCSVQVVKKGGKIIVVGVPSENVCFDLGKVMANELRIIGDLMYRNNFATAIEIVRTNSIDTDGLITRVFRLEEIADAFREIMSNKDKYMKCLVEP